jgi:hypothetical protein
VREADGNERLLPTYEHHLLCDENGAFPVDMNKWEIEVLEAEVKHSSFQALGSSTPRANS